MVRRPFESVRPFGPLFSSGNQQEPEVEEEPDEDNPILRQAEDWYQSISKEHNKRKMMKNYLASMTDLPESEIEQKLDEAGL